jgi:hypothetical protein
MADVNTELTEEQLRALYAWIDAIPLSRPKRSIARDFSDGVLFAEVIHAYFPALVEIHNYTPANNTKQKIYNFETLNQKVLRKFGYVINRPIIEDIVNCKPGAVESVLNMLQFKMAKYRERKAAGGDAYSVNSNNPSPRRESYNNNINNSNINNNNANNSNLRGGGRPGQPQQQLAPPQQQQQQRPQQGGRIGPAVSIDEELLLEKEQHIRDLQEQVEILELKIAKLEQLVRLKDNKIQKLMQR